MSIRELIDGRQSALLSEREELRSKLALVEAELADIAKAKAAIGAPELPGLLRIAAGVPASGSELPFSQLTLKQLTVRALRDHFRFGATATQLLETFKNAYGREVARSSLSPQLSRLKDEGELVREGRLWQLPAKDRSSVDKSAGAKVGGDGDGATSPPRSVSTLNCP